MLSSTDTDDGMPEVDETGEEMPALVGSETDEEMPPLVASDDEAGDSPPLV